MNSGDMEDPQQTTPRSFTIKVLGRTLEHLGVQMYKRRDVAIAELVANSWDAGADNVYIEVPDENSYDPANSEIVVTDDGDGMTDDQVATEYLVVGRNRRKDGDDDHDTRPVMGRKGIGKLAGFGIASKMTVATWRDQMATALTLDVSKLTVDDNQSVDVPIEGQIGPVPSSYTTPSGTRILLRDLKHKTPIKLDELREALARRFSRTVRGTMVIHVNGDPVSDPNLPLDPRVPPAGYETHALSNDDTVSYWYGFANKPIKSPSLRGFTIYVRGKTAQAPPFFFGVEGTASGQHGTRYLTGDISADFLDAGLSRNDDLISTDRQEIDWEDERTQALLVWGQDLTRRALREWAAHRGEQLEQRVFEDQGLVDRLERLDKTSQKQVAKMLHALAASDTDPDRELDLASTIVRAFEYRHFHDVVDEIEVASQDPEQLNQLLVHLNEWKVLESRAILEIIRNRLRIIDKFETLIVNNAPETASKTSDDNMHDMLAGNPWILNPDWQVLSEETSIEKQLREWNEVDPHPEYGTQRYDFLALTGDKLLVCIEIKRASHAVQLEEIQRLNEYRQRLINAHPDLHMVMITGVGFAIDSIERDAWRRRDDYSLLEWNEVFQKTRRFYEHYRDVLEGNVSTLDFATKQREIQNTRRVLDSGTIRRSMAEREAGLGTQDVNYRDDPT